jgi:hypothetical protein
MLFSRLNAMMDLPPRQGRGADLGGAQLGRESFLTPRERRESYLRNAAEARGIAERAHSESARERYLTLALFWTTLANEVTGVPGDALTG